MKKIILTCFSLMTISCGGKAFADCNTAPNGGTICTDSRSKSLTMTGYDLSNSANICLGTFSPWNNSGRYQHYCGYNSAIYDDVPNLKYSGVWSNSPGGIIAKTNLLNYKTQASAVKLIGQINLMFRARDRGFFGTWNGVVGSHPSNGSFFKIELLNADGTVLAQNSYGHHNISWDTPLSLSLSVDVHKDYLKPFYLKVYNSVPNNSWTAPFPVVEIQRVFLQAQDITQQRTGILTENSLTVEVPVVSISANEFRRKLKKLADEETGSNDYYRKMYAEYIRNRGE